MKKSTIILISVAGAILVISLGFTLFLGFSIKEMVRSGNHTSIVSGWSHEEATENVEEFVDTLTIQNVSGPIHIEAWEKDYTEIHYVKEAGGRSGLKDLLVEIERRGNNLSVRVVYPKIAFSTRRSVSFEVKIPASVESISANNVSGEIRIGDIGTSVDQELRTVSGRIRSGSSHNLTATSVSGSIRFVTSGKYLKLGTTSGSIEGEILGLEPSGSVKINSVSGSVELAAFPELDALVELKSVSGTITCGFPLQLISGKKNHLEGRIGAGSIPFHVETVSGGIALDRL